MVCDVVVTTSRDYARHHPALRHLVGLRARANPGDLAAASSAVAADYTVDHRQITEAIGDGPTPRKHIRGAKSSIGGVVDDRRIENGNILT